MIAFIEVHELGGGDGQRRLVNVDHIIYLQPSREGGSRILLTRDAMIVTESYETVVGLLREVQTSLTSQWGQ